MIVEDQPIIAMDMEATLSSLGFRIFGSVSNVQSGLKLLESGTPDAAILDYNLGSETSVEIAKVLDSRRVKLIYVTGWELDTEQNPDVPKAPIMSKPVDMNEVVSSYLT